jgi:hypothetical protein
MTDASLLQAQRARDEQIWQEEFDREFEMLMTFSNADAVGPDARHKLKGILRHYAKEPHPFRACVRDNTKRFGPGRVEKVCAVVKDIIRGTTKWRGHPAEDHGIGGAVAAADSLLLDEDTEKLLLSIPDEKLDRFFFSNQEER